MDNEAPDPGLDRKLTFVLKALDAMDSPLIRNVYAVWREKRGSRRFPAKAAITPRDIKDSLRFTSLMQVVDGGRDFAYRLRGDKLNQSIHHAYGEKLLGKTASEFVDLGDLYDLAHRPVVESGIPRLIDAFRHLGGYGVRCSEMLYLPLGDDDRLVDHIMAISVAVPRIEPWCNEDAVHASHV